MPSFSPAADKDKDEEEADKPFEEELAYTGAGADEEGVKVDYEADKTADEEGVEVDYEADMTVHKDKWIVASIDNREEECFNDGRKPPASDCNGSLGPHESNKLGEKLNSYSFDFSNFIDFNNDYDSSLEEDNC